MQTEINTAFACVLNDRTDSIFFTYISTTSLETGARQYM